MHTLKKFPEVMAHAREDLLANVSGRFSPDDWQSILTLALEKWEVQVPGELAKDPVLALKAWENVLRDFHSHAQWGFVADYKPPPKPKGRKNLGLRFILMAFLSFTVTKVAVAWFGQIYTRSDDPKDAYIFFAILALVVINFGYFLWSARGYEDDSGGAS